MDQVVLEPPFTDSHQSTSTMAPISSHKAQGVMSMESSVPSRPKLGCRLATPSNDDLVFDHVDNCLNTMQQQQQQIIRIRHSKIGIAKRRLPRARATATLLFSFQSLSSIFPILLFFIHLSFFIFSSSHPSQPITPTPPSLLFLQSSLSLSFLLPTASAYQVTWNNGPEDNYFCGMKWDDPQPCSVRQNCRTGKHEECEGFAEGEKCFAFTDCDSKAGGGHDFVPKIPDETPTVEPTGSRMPSLAPLPPGPTKIPTEMPIGPPPPLDRSDDPTDYWFCGIGIDDTNQRCETHCPTASECPMGEICYFGTRCDARTHAPTPPPTRRPTDSPTPSPTASPTASDAPSWSPTASSEPSVAPTKQGPTRSPTRSPTKRPTWAPLTDVQTEMFCGLSWQDVTSKCRERCPSGEDTECPEGFFCFAYTGCQEEKGYPEDEYQHLNGHGDEQSEGDSGNADGKDEEKQEEEMEPCVPFQVTITPDNWPQEISWTLTNEAGEVVADDGNEEMTKGKPYVWLECVPRRECYEFKIMDSGGDGLCCDHGDGNYKVDFDEQLVKVGAAFYNDEIVEVGVCGETAAPTKAETASPTIAPTIKTVKITKAPTPAEELNTDNSEEDNLASAISPSGKAYRCVASQLVDSGYALSANMCDKFDGCYNEWIGAGDDWFCEEGSQCVVAPACGANSDGDNNGNENDGDSVGNGNGDEADTETNTNVVEEKQNERPRPSPNPTPGSATRPKRTPNPTREVVSRTKRPTPNPVAVPSRPQRPVAVIAPEPTSNPTNALMTSTPTKSPTATPSQTPTQAVSTMSPTTIAPTLGPCDGDPCPIISQCRSQFGFCGPDELYCNERSIWTEECGTKDPTPSPIVATIPTEIIQTVTTSPVQSTTTKAPTPAVAKVPFFKKPSGGGKPKPSGGKPPFESVESSNSVPTRAPQLSQPTDPPQSIPPTVLTTWIIFPKPTPSPTPPPTPPPTPSPTLAPNTPAPNNENYVVLNSSDAVSINMITNSPTAGLLSEGALDSNEEENDSDEDTQCSGDPCPVASHCRSRYGSCGPGFIYCNQYTIWTSACPAKPTKKPTSKPTKSPSAVVKKTKSPVASPAIEPPKNEPTLPTLPKPTLPHLTEPLPVELPDFASAAHSITADGGEDEESGNDDADDDDTNEEEDDLGGTAAEGENNMFTSDEYLTEWNSWKKRKLWI